VHLATSPLDQNDDLVDDDRSTLAGEPEERATADGPDLLEDETVQELLHRAEQRLDATQ
jgi:hypothetical protein